MLYKQLLNPLQEFVSVSVRVDPDGLEFLVSHLSQDVQRDVLSLKDVPEVIKTHADEMQDGLG